MIMDFEEPLPGRFKKIRRKQYLLIIFQVERILPGNDRKIKKKTERYAKRK